MQKDYHHNDVIEALIKDGWTITTEQLTVQAGQRSVYIDIAAEKIITAQRGLERIAVEVKSFLAQSPVINFSEALGKFEFYSFALRTTLPRRSLYIAMPLPAYDELFTDPFIQDMAKFYALNIIVFEPINKEIVSWIKN